MAVLMIGATEREKIADMIAQAKAHPLTLEIIRQFISIDNNADVLKLKDRPAGFERPPSQHILFPGGYRAAFCIEEQPAGFCNHLSISVVGRAKKGMMPNEAAIKMIAEEFGVPYPADKMWMEEFEPGEYAINLLSLYAPTTGGNA